MSVAWAPRARMAVKASWPGVSRNVTLPVRGHHLIRADVLVMPPNLLLGHLRATDGVEEGGLAVVDAPHDRDDADAGHADPGRPLPRERRPRPSGSRGRTRTCRPRAWPPWRRATRSPSRITPSSRSALITSPDFLRIFSASSATVTDSGSRTSSRFTSTAGASTTGASTVAVRATTGSSRGGGEGGAGAAGSRRRLTGGGRRGRLGPRRCRRSRRADRHARREEWTSRLARRGPRRGRHRALERTERNDLGLGLASGLRTGGAGGAGVTTGLGAASGSSGSTGTTGGSARSRPAPWQPPARPAPWRAWA